MSEAHVIPYNETKFGMKQLIGVGGGEIWDTRIRLLFQLHNMYQTS
jgi:hypothetical protein